MIALEDLLARKYKGEGASKLPERLLCLDPGETTGWCVFTKGELTHWGQALTMNKQTQMIDWDKVHGLIETIEPTQIVCEDYRVYSHKLDRHAFSKVPTLRIIGGFEYGAWLSGIPIHYQMAFQAKGFVTDAKLKEWGLWQDGLRHSRDAIRHGIYFLVVSNKI